jgi:hypothetical protein
MSAHSLKLEFASLFPEDKSLTRREMKIGFAVHPVNALKASHVAIVFAVRINYVHNNLLFVSNIENSELFVNKNKKDFIPGVT